MKITPRLGAGKSGDPSLYLDITERKRGILFDCGNNSFRHANLRKVSDLFISHTHIDHFIGFDTLLRLNLTEEKTIHVYGPPGIYQNVTGKLQGYTWNICHNLPLTIVVHEVLPEKIIATELESCRGFAVKHSSERPNTATLLDTGEYCVRYIQLDHKTPSFGYTLIEADTSNVQKEVMQNLGFEPGPWVAQLKALAFDPEAAGTLLQVGEQAYPLEELVQQLLVRKSGIKITYLTDFLFDPHSIDSIARFAEESDLLFCEAAFSEKDLEKAKTTHHLTAKEAGVLARMAHVKQLILFHFSRRYQDYSLLLDEARAEFPHVE